MIEINGKYASARVFADTLDPSAAGQIKAYCDRECARGSRIRVMPDVHAGKGSVIGMTMTLTDSVVPNIVGVDIGCGMLTVRLREKRIDLPRLDSFVRQNIPFGQAVREKPHRLAALAPVEELECVRRIDIRRAAESIGSLGGGNHFIEVDTDGEALYLVIHSGSRNLGLRVAEYYQEQAYIACGGRAQTDIPYELASLSGAAMQSYLHDMALMQRFAELNRAAIGEVILSGLKLHAEESLTTVHNYIDPETMILRKGAVSAKKGERLLIPINMRDGSLLCTGLGCEDWNCSAPHGAGRLMSRREAEQSLTVSQFKRAMEGIYTTCVAKDTLDESPFAYKPAEDILRHITGTVTVDRRLRPIYNFKASENAGRPNTKGKSKGR